MSAPKHSPSDNKQLFKQIAKIQARYTILANQVEKDENKYLFIGRNYGEFSGNVKYLFLHFLKHHPEVECRFLTQRRDVYHELVRMKLPVLLYPSDKVDWILRAGTVIVDSISYRRQIYWPLIAGARQVQLWHGIGNKKIGFQLAGSVCLKGRDQTLIEDHEGYDVVVSTSEFYTEEVFKKSLGAKEFVSLGYPRTDIFFERVTREALVGCDVDAYSRIVRAKKKGPVVLFAPTFRDNGISPLTQEVLNFDAFIALLNKLGAHLLIKAHTRTSVDVSGAADNVTVCKSVSDIYPFLPMVDVMITDYSSIFTEFLLLDRPVIFFWADFDIYMSHDRGLQFPAEEMSPGPQCRSVEELVVAVVDAVQGKDTHRKERTKLRDKSFAHLKGGASARIADYLINQSR